MVYVISKADRGSVEVPSADGYHFGDDHVWDVEEQQALVKKLGDAHDALANGSISAEQRRLVAELSAARARVARQEITATLPDGGVEADTHERLVSTGRDADTAPGTALA